MDMNPALETLQAQIESSEANIADIESHIEDTIPAMQSSIIAAQTTADSKAKMTLLTATLLADDWDDNGELTITENSIPDPTSSGGDIRAPQNIAMDVLDALEAARPWVISQAAGSIRIKARGTIPTVDIPIEIEVRA